MPDTLLVTVLPDDLASPILIGIITARYAPLGKSVHEQPDPFVVPRCS